MIEKLSTGDEVHRYLKGITIEFNEKRKVLSTSILNGGFRDDLTAIFNKDENPGAGMASALRAPTYEEHMKLIATELGLNPDTSTGISTAASMDNVAIKTEKFDDVTVTAIITGGVEVNGGRVGDVATYHEKSGKTEMIKSGTINIILNIDADLPEGTMTRALITCTEAKTAVLQELMAGSNYSRGIATGSGTDGTIIIANPNSKAYITNVGKHSKVGELVGRAVMGALKEALFLQTGMSPSLQHSILKRLKRFGVNEDTLWDIYINQQVENSLSKAQFINNVHFIDNDNKLVTLTSLVAHLFDQNDWGLLSLDEVNFEFNNIISRLSEMYEIDFIVEKIDDKCPVESMIKCYSELLSIICGGLKNV